MIFRWRAWWLLLLLILLPAPVSCQTDSLLAVKVVRVVDGDTIQVLLAAGADVHAKDRRGRTALMLARRYPNTVQILKEAGARE